MNLRSNLTLEHSTPRRFSNFQKVEGSRASQWECRHWTKLSSTLWDVDIPLSRLESQSRFYRMSLRVIKSLLTSWLDCPTKLLLHSKNHLSWLKSLVSATFHYTYWLSSKIHLSTTSIRKEYHHCLMMFLSSIPKCRPTCARRKALPSMKSQTLREDQTSKARTIRYTGREMLNLPLLATEQQGSQTTSGLLDLELWTDIWSGWKLEVKSIRRKNRNKT